MKPYVFTSALLLYCSLGASNKATAQATTATKQLPTYIGELRGFIGDGYGQFRSVPADEIAMNEPTVVGSTFLSENWEKGSIYLTLNRKLENQQLKYDIEQNQFLILNSTSPNPAQESDDFEAVSGVSVLAFEVDDPLQGKRLFLNAMNAGFTDGGTPYPGFMEVLIEGSLNLYRKVETSVLKASYNVALNAGEKKDRIIKKESFFVRRADEKELHEISKGKENTLKLLDNQRQAEAYVKENKIKFKQQDDLVKLVTFYNTL